MTYNGTLTPSPRPGRGSGERLAKPHQAGQEEAARLRAADLEAQSRRSEHAGGHAVSASGVAGAAREAAARTELSEVAGERAEAAAEAAADEEYSHMGRVQKWLMEAKAALYAWLKTGVEPL